MPFLAKFRHLKPWKKGGQRVNKKVDYFWGRINIVKIFLHKNLTKWAHAGARFPNISVMTF
jgi:hypothetical protein